MALYHAHSARRVAVMVPRRRALRPAAHHGEAMTRSGARVHLGDTAGPNHGGCSVRKSQ